MGQTIQDQGQFIVEDLPEFDASGNPILHLIRFVFVPDPPVYSTAIVVANADGIHPTVATGILKVGECQVNGVNNYITAVTPGSPNDTLTLLVPSTAIATQLIAQGGFQRNTWLYGLLLEKRLGYSQPAPRLRLLNGGTLTAAQVAISMGSFANDYMGIRSIVYTNTDTVNRVVTLQYNSVTIWQATIAAATSATFDMGGLFSGADSSLFTHAADLTAKVNWGITVGGQ
jgi:hypothetical protein